MKKQQHWIMTIYTDSYRVYRRNLMHVYLYGEPEHYIIILSFCFYFRMCKPRQSLSTRTDMERWM